jgi:hypothetical protein
MFPITITIANTAQLNAVMAALATGDAVAQEVAAAPAPKQKATPAKTAPPANTQPTAEAVQEPAPENKPEPSATTQAADAPAAAEAPAVAFDAVRDAIMGLSKAKGRDAAVAVLGTFGVAKAPELKAEQYADVVAAAKKAMA